MGAVYTNASPDGRYQFHLPDGTEVVIGSEPYATDDAFQIAHLDASPFVLRANDKPSKKGEEA